MSARLRGIEPKWKSTSNLRKRERERERCLTIQGISNTLDRFQDFIQVPVTTVSVATYRLWDLKVSIPIISKLCFQHVNKLRLIWDKTVGINLWYSRLKTT